MTQPGINRQMNRAEWGMLITLSVLWGGSFFFNGVAVRELPTLTIVLGRVGIAALALHIFMRVTAEQYPRLSVVWLPFIIMGFFNNFVPFGLIVWGQQYLTSGLASIVNATTPIFALITAHVMTRDERMSVHGVAGVVLGLLGVVVLIGPDALDGIGTNVIAQLALIGAAVSYGLAVVYGRRFRQLGVSSIATATGQVTASSLLLLPVVLWLETPWLLPMPSLFAIGAVVGLALLSTAIAYILYFRILASAGATNLSLVTLLVPVSAITLGILFLDETLLLRHLLGFGLIALGLLTIDGRIIDRLRRR